MLHLHDVIGRPWAIQGEIARQAQDVLNRGGFAALRQLAAMRVNVQPGAYQDDEPSAGPRTNTRRAGTVAVIPLMGMVTHRGAIVGCEETASSMAFANEMQAAAADAQVDAIVAEFDSPGGEVIGIAEAAAAMREARAVKPVVAVANGIALSAAYWLASQADELLVISSGLLGSIGVYGAHEDISKALEAEGVKVTLVSAGKFKVERNPYEPLGEEARTAMQGDVDRYYDMFVKDVAKGRKVSVDVVRGATFGQGRIVGARPAVEQGMADGIGGLAEGVRRAVALARARGKAPAAPAAMSVAQAQALRIRRERT